MQNGASVIKLHGGSLYFELTDEPSCAKVVFPLRTVAAARHLPPSNTKTVTLSTPIKRGEQRITEVTLREPNAGALRGISLTDVLQLNVSAMIELLPRITEPALIRQEIAAMGPVDITAVGVELVGFFVPKEQERA